MSYLFQFLVSAIALYFTAKYVPGINYTSSSALLVFVIVLALANLLLGTVLKIVTFPLKFLTLGLSSLAISLLMVYLADYFVDGISIKTIIALISVSLVTGVIAMLFRFFR